MRIGRTAAAAALVLGTVLLVLGTASPASAGTTSWSGTLAPGDTTWPRPDCLGDAGSEEFYDVQAFHVTADGSYTIEMTTMTGTNSPDGYYLLYTPSFDASAPATNCIAENDDGGVGLAPLLTLDLLANTTYVLVTTQCCDGVTADEAIAYTNTVTGPGDIALGPFQIPTTTTSTTTSSTTSTTAAPTSTTAAPTTTTRPASAVLARTGSSVTPMSIAGAALIAGGFATMLVVRRRIAV